MFKSQLSGKQYGPGVSPVRVVIETRTKTYVNTFRTPEGMKTVVSQGYETVKELLIGPDEKVNGR